MSWVNGKFKRVPRGTVRYKYKKKQKCSKTRLTLDDLDKIFDAHLKPWLVRNKGGAE